MILTIILAFAAGGFDAKNKPYGTAFFTSILFLLVAILGAYTEGFLNGKGTLAEDINFTRLKEDEVYEVKNSLPINNKDGQFLVLIQDRFLNIKAYKMDQVPPRVFKKTEDKDRPYVPFPDPEK